jgi:peptide deformylase
MKEQKEVKIDSTAFLQKTVNHEINKLRGRLFSEPPKRRVLQKVFCGLYPENSSKVILPCRL